MSTSASPPESSQIHSKTYPEILFFGDSITQGSELYLLPRLRDAYVRKADLLNRGFSGYTAPMGLTVLPSILPANPSSPQLRWMTIFFGANDACLPGNLQHVPLRTYVSSLEQIVTHPHVQSRGAKPLLIVPTPVDEWCLDPADPTDPSSQTSRSAANTKRYADACRELGQRLNLPTVDLWTLFMTAAGWDSTNSNDDELPGSKTQARNPVLGRLLTDGLHFSAEAYDMMGKELMRVLAAHYPEETPEQLPSIFPNWDQVLRGERRLDE